MYIIVKRIEIVRFMKFGENVVRFMVLKGLFFIFINLWEGDIGLFFLLFYFFICNLLFEYGVC